MTTSKTLLDFFGPQTEENERISLGNRILRDLEELDFEFAEQHEILKGRKAANDLPDNLAADIEVWQKATAKKEVEDAKYEKEQEQEKAIVLAAKARIETGNHTNADLDLVVGAGLARHVYGEDSNRPVSIEWIVSNSDPYFGHKEEDMLGVNS